MTCHIWYVTYHIIWSICTNISLESSESADLLAVRYGNYYPDNIDARAEDDVTELNGLVFLFTKQLLIPNSAFIFRSQSYDFNFALKNYVCFSSNKTIGPVWFNMGYIDVGDGCWRPNVLWWQIWDVGDRNRLLVTDLIYWEDRQHND